MAICIATLRKIFRTAGLDRETIITATPGYMLSLTGHSLDSLRFERLVARATELTAENRPAPAADALRQALALWRGPALGGVYAPFAETEAARLDEQRMLAVEQLTALRLQLGEHQSVLGELQALVGACPLRDRLRYYLMLAQYRSGRRAEALTTFRDGMRHSIEEIGLELGTDLQALHDSILRDEFPQLDVPGIAVQQRDRQQTVPTQLPESDAYFIGRSREQWLMDDVLLDGSAQNPSPIAYITGSPGIGKTSLAVNWAHRTAHRFPDGQLFADLREGDTLGVLHRFLRQLGAEGPLPTEPADAAERYRGMLEGRRVLIVLDHASSYTQVRHLLPTSGGCCVLITGRANLDELMQKYRALRLRVAPLSDDESRETLTSVLRDARAEESPEATSRLAALCGHTPRAAGRRGPAAHQDALAGPRSGPPPGALGRPAGGTQHRGRLAARPAGPQHAGAGPQGGLRLPGVEPSRRHGLRRRPGGAGARHGPAGGRGPDRDPGRRAAPGGGGRGGAWGEMRYRWQELVRLHALHCLTAATPCGAALTD